MLIYIAHWTLIYDANRGSRKWYQVGEETYFEPNLMIFKLSHQTWNHSFPTKTVYNAVWSCSQLSSYLSKQRYMVMVKMEGKLQKLCLLLSVTQFEFSIRINIQALTCPIRHLINISHACAIVECSIVMFLLIQLLQLLDQVERGLKL